ncbi:glycoprotein Xg isoform X1 [Pteropus vampyrus]|uniref:Glycoprotein Xg isoform X1 n=1 Tax=Pteropus vampyrus TaxID=132908 RepID=A0A6P6C0I0_PTEVA|nr:glycoprotein Xg isoform X1 [Pteropus vampyrus]
MPIATSTPARGARALWDDTRRWHPVSHAKTLRRGPCRVRGIGRCQGDFDLADALDDPEPTKKPGSGLYPKLKPHQPEPGNPDSGNIYPRPKPPAPRPQPGISDSGGGRAAGRRVFRGCVGLSVPSRSSLPAQVLL